MHPTIFAAAIVVGLSFPAFAVQPAHQTSAPAVRAVEGWNLSRSRLAIEGYDPVAYFPEGGGKPLKGSDKLELNYGGVVYRFATAANRDAFKANPARYEPAHGGWCTYAMGKSGDKVEIDPKSFVVADGRLFLFYKSVFSDTRKSFLKDAEALTMKADTNWRSSSGESPRDGAKAGADATTSATLRSKLDARRAEFEKSSPPDRVRTYDEGVTAVAESDVLKTALRVGAKAPDFALPNARGGTTTLSQALKDGPVVLTWYRGGWCPYCNIQLRAYQEALPEIRAAGGTLVAISPELPDQTLTTAEKQQLEFSVLSDTGNKVAAAYGIAYRLPEPIIDAFKGRLDIPAANGDDSWTLPLGVTYVVARDGTITYAFIDADYRKRAEPAEIIAAVREAAER